MEEATLEALLIPEATEGNLKELVKTGALDEAALEPAMQIAGLLPDRQAWIGFVSLVLQVLGALFLISGIVYFLAFNWAGLDKYVKLGLPATGILIATGLAYWRKLDRVSGKVALSAAAVLAGGLLAVYGQIYQTGADSYQLFVLWALLITGWAAIGRFVPLWVFWLLLLNIGLILYWDQIVASDPGLLSLAIFGLNGAALLLYELAQRKGVSWMQGRWAPRLIALPLFGALLLPATLLVSGSWAYTDAAEKLAGILLLPLCVATLVIYSRMRLDQFILLVASGCVIWLADVWIIGTGYDEAALLFAGIATLGAAAFVVMWLRHITQRWGGALS